MSHFSLRTLYRLGDATAFVLRYSSNQVTRQTRQNIALCFSDLDQFVINARARTGGIPVSTKKSGLRQLLVGLKKGGCVTILPDQ